MSGTTNEIDPSVLTLVDESLWTTAPPAPQHREAKTRCARACCWVPYPLCARDWACECHTTEQQDPSTNAPGYAGIVLVTQR